MVAETHLRIVSSNPDVPLIEGVSNGLEYGGGGPHDTGMEARVSVLENEVKHIREDLGEIKSTLGQIAGKLSELPTKRDLSSWTWQFVAVGAGVIAIVVGGIVGGLSWIQPEPAREIIREILAPAPTPNPPQIIYIQPSGPAQPPPPAQ